MVNVAMQTSRTGWKRFCRLLSVISITALAVTGCAGIPYHSEVNIGEAIQNDEELGLVIDAPPARPGESAISVVRGFLRAAASTRGDYSVARTFLGGEFASEWDSSARVLIHESNLNIHEIAEGKFVVDVPVYAEIDASGLFVKSPNGKNVSIEFDLEQVDGEWRIINTSDGIVIPRRIFTEVFNNYSVYFYTDNFNYLVPDTRWFVNRSSIPTTLVTQLIDGPAKWLNDTLSTAFPEGVSLAINAVTVENRVATVELNAEYLTTNSRQRQLIHAQIDATLRNLPSISSSRITVNGQEVSSSSGDGGVPPIGPRVSDLPMIILSGHRNEGIGYFGDHGFESLDSMQEQLKDVDAKSIAFNFASQQAAVITEDGVLAISSSRKTKLLEGVFQEASIDAVGRVWAINSETNHLHVASNVESNTLNIPVHADEYLSSFAVSREGSRIIFAVQKENEWNLWASGISYDQETLLPETISQPLLLGSGSGTVQTLTWQNDNTVLALIDSGSSKQILTQQVGGVQYSLGVPWDLVNISATNVPGIYYVLSEEGQLMQRVQDRWSTVLVGVLALVQQG